MFVGRRRDVCGVCAHTYIFYTVLSKKCVVVCQEVCVCVCVNDISNYMYLLYMYICEINYYIYLKAARMQRLPTSMHTSR